MAKIQTVFELLQDTQKSLSDTDKWMSFLRTAAWQYKYPFEDQVLIYAQRPDATACADIDVWNKRMHRWINKGSKGIALLRENGNQYRLEYVFDVADTNSRFNKEIQLWQYDEKCDSAIIETLANAFGDVNTDSGIYQAVYDSVHNAVEDNTSDYLHELSFVKNNSLLRGLDDTNLEYRFRQTVEASVRYAVMCRMAVSADDTIEREDFEYIRDFNTLETISILGNAVSSISEQTLRNISETIRAEQRREKFDERSRAVYNIVENNTNNINTERNENNGRDNIQNDRRLSDTGTDSSAGGIHDRQVRNDEKNISQGTPQEPVFNNADERNSVKTLGGDRQNSERAGTENSNEYGKSRGSNGEHEGEGSVTMDGLNEQPSPFGGGDSSPRTGVQLSLWDIPLPSEEEQKNMIEEAEQKRGSAFSVSQQIIDEVLTTGGNDTDSILKICVQYSKNKTVEDNIEFLKNEYGKGGKGFIFDGRKVSVWWNTDGVRISYGDRATDRGQLITWEDTSRRIGELLELSRFAPQETLDKIQDFELKTAARYFYEMYRDANHDEYPELREQFDLEWFDGSYQDTIDRVSELFKRPENIEPAIDTAGLMNTMYAENRGIMRWRIYSPDKVLNVLNDLKLEHRTFTADKFQSSSAQRFITEDEIDNLFTRGSGYDRGKIRIYLYFQEIQDPQERIKFLKQEYGTGGYGGGIFSESHDAKGIVFSRSDILSPLAKVNVSWNQAERRIDSLIKSGKYLTEREINEDIPKYQSEQEQQRIRNEKYDYLRNMDSLSSDEKIETLPRRISYFTDIMDEYEKGFFTQYGVDKVLSASELETGELIKDNIFRNQLADCMQKISGEAASAIDRNCGHSFSEELRNLKIINLHRAGDFYEIYGNEAEKASELLDIALTKKLINGVNVLMTGVPVFSAEHYSRMLEENGYIVNFHQKEYDLGFGKLGNGITVWNKLEEENNDYKTVAHISDDGEVKYYEDMPDDVKQQIEEQAAFEKDSNEEETSQNLKSEDKNSIIGKELTIDDRKFVVENVDDISGDVTLRDITFENGVGFPINRIEKLEFVERLLKEREQPKTDLTPKIERSHPQLNTAIYPEIPMSERHNFHITDDNLGHGTPTEKYRANVEAIRTLKKLENEQRLATPDEQEILSRYVGWGGLADCFDEKSSHYAELKSMLTDEEYSAARESTLTAFYTPPVVIRSMYKALENMGLKNGNILDPSMGIGNFEGLLPESLGECKVYGIELDSISGRIAQQLYQKNNIEIKGYENTSLPDSFFDAAVGNVPFGDFKVLDKRYDKNNFLIHDYFFGATRS